MCTNYNVKILGFNAFIFFDVFKRLLTIGVVFPFIFTVYSDVLNLSDPRFFSQLLARSAGGVILIWWRVRRALSIVTGAI